MQRSAATSRKKKNKTGQGKENKYPCFYSWPCAGDMDDSPVPPPSNGVPLLTATLGNSGSFSVVLWCGGDVLDYCSFPWIDGSDPQGSRTDMEARGDRLWTTEECIKKLVELTARLSSPCDVVLSGVVPAKLVLLEGMFKVRSHHILALVISYKWCSQYRLFASSGDFTSNCPTKRCCFARWILNQSLPRALVKID